MSSHSGIKTTRTALVSTNSITQGEQVSAIWKPLFENFHIHIDFAWRTFRWDSESSLKAHVHCVIIGFSCDKSNNERYIYDANKIIKTAHINFYLLPADDIFIGKRTMTESDCVAELFKLHQKLTNKSQ